MRDQLIRAHALCKLLDLIDSEIDLAKEERDDIYNAIADVGEESSLDSELANQAREGFDARIAKTLVNLRDKLTIEINYIFMLEQLQKLLEDDYPAPAFKDLPF